MELSVPRHYIFFRQPTDRWGTNTHYTWPRKWLNLMIKKTNLNDGTGSGGDTGPQISAFLGNGASDGRALHFTLGLIIHELINKNELDAAQSKLTLTMTPALSSK